MHEKSANDNSFKKEVRDFINKNPLLKERVGDILSGNPIDLMGEKADEDWEAIKNYSGLYFVSNRGRIMSVRNGLLKPKYLKPIKGSSGLPRVNLYDYDGKGTTHRIDVLVTAAFGRFQL